MGIATLVAHAALLVASSPTSHPDADLSTIDGTINELYAVMSRTTPGTRDWDRFKALFDPHARIILNRNPNTARAGSDFFSLSTDDYRTQNEKYFMENPFVEKELHRETMVYGGIAQVLSTYELKAGLAPAEWTATGVNMIQLYFKDGRWFIQGIVFRPSDQNNPIPARLLPPR